MRRCTERSFPLCSEYPENGDLTMYVENLCLQLQRHIGWLMSSHMFLLLSGSIQIQDFEDLSLKSLNILSLRPAF
jgi:hypothetical protein